MELRVFAWNMTDALGSFEKWFIEGWGVGWIISQTKFPTRCVEVFKSGNVWIASTVTVVLLTYSSVVRRNCAS
jgi:hypothetical protein